MALAQRQVSASGAPTAATPELAVTVPAQVTAPEATMTSGGKAAPQMTSGCGKQCMGPCCLADASMPVYYFPRKAAASHAARREGSYGNLSSCSAADGTQLTESSDSSGSGSDSEDSSEAGSGQRRSFLDSLMLNLWEERSEEGLFRYDVTACETKVIPGRRGYVAQFNEGRHSKKRPTEFRMDSVLQPFDKSKFNFTKVHQREALVAYQEAPEGEGEGAEEAGSFLAHSSVAKLGADLNVIAINVSPVEYGHVLLIPRILDCSPQQMSAGALLLALRFAAEVNNPCFRLGYNSLGAFATVNHLHFQGYYLQQQYAIERASAVPVWGPQRSGGLAICELEDFPVRGLVYVVGGSHQEAAEAAGAACEELQRRNTPFNLFISASGSTIFLWPQCFAERQARGEVGQELLDTQVNPAVFEIAGHMIMKRREDYEGLSEEGAEALLAAVSLGAHEFAEVKALCLKAAEEAAASAVAEGGEEGAEGAKEGGPEGLLLSGVSLVPQEESVPESGEVKALGKCNPAAEAAGAAAAAERAPR